MSWSKQMPLPKSDAVSGRTNAPYMIPYTLQSLANYLDKPLTEVAQATRKTTREVYGI